MFKNISGKFAFGGIAFQLALAGCTQKYGIQYLPGPAVLGYGQGSSTTDSAKLADESFATVTTLDVGTTPLGSYSKAYVDVANTGGMPATLASITATAVTSTTTGTVAPVTSSGSIYALNNTCSGIIQPGERCRVYISYTPNNLGQAPGTVTVTYNDGKLAGKTLDLPVTANANNLAFLKFDVDTLSFNQNTIGYTLSVLFKVIYNGTQFNKNGVNNIQPAQGVIISDPPNGAFQIDRTAATTCGDVINTDCFVQVNFAPSAIGTIASSFKLSYFNSAEVANITGQVGGTAVAATTLATLSAGSGSFGSVVANQTTPVGLAIPINFSGSVPATSFTVSAPKTAAYTISADTNKTTCKTSVSGSCQIYILFNPTAYVAYPDSLTVTYSSNGQTRPNLTIPLSGTGVMPAHLTLTPATTLAFGSVPAYKTASLSFSLKNDGAVAISLLSVISSTDTTDFSTGFGGSCATLAAGASCNLNVNFKPESAAAKTTTLGFTYYDGRATQTISLSATGTGTAPLDIENSGTLDFGNVMIGATITQPTITQTLAVYGTTSLTNASQLVFNPTSLSSPFNSPTGAFPGGGTCKAPINPNTMHSCNFVVGLTSVAGRTPDVAITQAFSLAYTGDAPGGGSGTLNYTAKVTPRSPPVLSFVSAAASFATISVNNSETIALTIKNASPYFATTFKAATITGSSEFTIASDGCSGGVAAGGSCVVNLKFNPTAVGAVSGTFTYQYTDQINPQTITASLSGTGSANLTVTASPTTIDFGTVFIGDSIPTQAIALTVYGQGAWQGTSNVAAPFSITPQSCGASAVNCNLTVGFVPTTPGSFSSTVTYTYSPGLTSPSTLSFQFRGTAVYRAAGISFSGTSFPKTMIGQKASQTITISNTGTSTANNIGLTIAGTTFFFTPTGAPGTSGNCSTSQTLAPGSSCTVGVSFIPGTLNTNTTTLTAAYVDSAQQNSANASATLTGKGTQQIQVFAGAYQTCMINEVGQAVCWGRNTSGQLGTGNANAVSQTVQNLSAINFGTGILPIKIAVGDAHTCALLKSTANAGFISCWGSNQSGRLGLGTTTASYYSPLDGSGNVYTVSLGTGEIATDIAAGFEHTCAVLKSGKVKCWGGNTSGQLGTDSTASLGTTPSQMGDGLAAINLGGGLAVSVAAGAGHTCVVLKDLSTRCWGDNFYGQLGQARSDSQIGNATGGMASLNAISLWSTSVGQSVYASNGAFTCVVSTTGAVKCFGKMVGDETTSTPFYGVLGECLARASYNSTAKSCAANPTLTPSTSLGYYSTDMGTNLAAVNIAATKSLAVGVSFICSLGTDYNVRCFGLNDDGQLGQGTTTSIGANASDMGANIPTSISAASGIATGYAHTCAALQNNTIKCWGASTLNATGLSMLGVTSDSGVSASTAPAMLPIVYDGR